MHASGCSVYAKVHSNVAAAPLLKRVLFNYALKAKLRNLHNKGEASDAGRARHATRWLLLRHCQPLHPPPLPLPCRHAAGVFSHPLFDRLVFNKLRALMGGRVRIIVTSSAPIAAHVKEFLQASRGVRVGMTCRACVGRATRSLRRNDSSAAYLLLPSLAGAGCVQLSRLRGPRHDRGRRHADNHARQRAQPEGRRAAGVV